MHASTEQLLNLRDGVPVAAGVAQHVSGCDACSDELDRLHGVRAGLQALPPAAAPATAWNGVAARLDAPGLQWRHRVAAAAAAMAVAAVVAWAMLPLARQADESATRAGAAPAPQPADLDELVSESRQLERLLRTLDRQSPRTMSAGTAGTIAGLEDGIALIDYGLTYNEMSGEASQRLWRQRVDLMHSLVQVRGAQLQRVSN